MREILKRYKAWFGNILILLCLMVYVILSFLQNGLEGLIAGGIVVIIASFIFPPLTIIVDAIMKKRN